jgi:MFS family permease
MLVDYWRFACANPRFLGFGFFLAFLSSAGQTYFIGVFGPGIQADFGLDTGSWGQIYMLGTLASALVINWSGTLIDRLDLRLFTGLVLAGLAGACLVMGSVTSPMLLVVAIFMLRQFGQGLASHAGITSMARYYDHDRGKAIALAAIGYAFGEALLPVAGLYAATLWGWRDTFQVVALVVLLSLLPALWLLKGQKLRHANHTAALAQRAAEADGRSDYTRGQMLSEARFYYLLPAMIATPMIGTALFFFPDEIARAKGWRPDRSLQRTPGAAVFPVATRAVPGDHQPVQPRVPGVAVHAAAGHDVGALLHRFKRAVGRALRPQASRRNQVADQRNHGVFVGAGPGGGWHTAAMAGVVFCDYDIAGRVLCQRDADAVLRAANAQ